MLPQLDATDGLAAAYCHFYKSESLRPKKRIPVGRILLLKIPEKLNSVRLGKIFFLTLQTFKLYKLQTQIPCTKSCQSTLDQLQQK